MSKFKIALLCGGPSLERGISLNSARTVLDHLQSDKIKILPVYFDYRKKPYLISRAQLYSNTPSDFDFKINQTAKALKPKQLINFLKKATISFPVIHGKFGEDGQLQKLLEKNNLPFIGSPAKACRLAFDKFNSAKFLKNHGYYALPSLLLLKNNYRRHQADIIEFFRRYRIKRAIVKPANGGSSIAVYAVADLSAALKSTKEIFLKNIDNRVVLEPFCRGREFTVIILENKFNQPVAILPTEIQLARQGQQIFDYRKKYLATNQVRYHCPPKFSDKTIYKIQAQAQELFRLFGLRDFARFDGWLMPDGKIWFSDFNPVSGLEQNSFLFMQSSRLGFSHRNLLKYIVTSACRRYGLYFPSTETAAKDLKRRKKINVIFGGQTAERQVSVMSGTNVWLKLKNSSKYNPQPFLLDTKNQVWRLPYTLTLNHTVEEIAATCRQAKDDEQRLKNLRSKIIAALKPGKKFLSQPWFLPEKMSLKKFVERSPYIFIGLHGGAGENGQLQKTLERNRKPFNGSGSVASRLCMDKFATGQTLRKLKNHGIYSAKKVIINLRELKKIIAKKIVNKYWQSLQTKLGIASMIVKPVDDGCSAGIARLFNANDLKTYLNYVWRLTAYIPKGQLTNQTNVIEMPSRPMQKIMFEKFIATDKIQAIGNKLKWEEKTDWIEITCGLLERNGKMRAFNPSLTVALGNVLTLEEKFQGGTGINITPPPTPYVKSETLKLVKKRMEIVAKALNLRGYARLDAFMNVKSGKLIIIEANTLPGLTPSTVIFHQALAERPMLYPKEFLEKIVGGN